MSYVEPMVRISYGGVVPDAFFDNSQSCRWGSLPIGKDEFAFGTEKYVKFTRGMFGSRGTVTASGKEAHYENAHKLMRQVLELAHARGIRMAMGFEFGIIPPEYFSVNPSGDSFYWRGEAGLIPNPCKPMSAGIHRAAVEDIIDSYPGIDYVWLWLSEHSFMGVNPDHALGDPAFRKLYDENAHYFSKDMSVSEKILGVWSLEYIRQTMEILSEHGSEARIIIGGWGGGKETSGPRDVASFRISCRYRKDKGCNRHTMVRRRPSVMALPASCCNDAGTDTPCGRRWNPGSSRYPLENVGDQIQFQDICRMF